MEKLITSTQIYYQKENITLAEIYHYYKDVRGYDVKCTLEEFQNRCNCGNEDNIFVLLRLLNR